MVGSFSDYIEPCLRLFGSHNGFSHVNAPLRSPVIRDTTWVLHQLDQLDVLVAKAEMVIEAERAHIGRAGTECEYPVALIARPLLARLSRAVPTPLPSATSLVASSLM